MIDSITLDGKRYTAEVRPGDMENYSALCESHGTRRCAIIPPHSSYVHLVIGLAETAGTVKDV